MKPEMTYDEFLNKCIESEDRLDFMDIEIAHSFGRKEAARDILMVVLHGLPIEEGEWSDVKFECWVRNKYGIDT